MSNMNPAGNKTNLSIIVLIVVVLIFVYPVYFVNSKIRNYKTEVLGEYTKYAELESEKNVLDMYNKILLKGSKESLEIKKHVLSNDRKEVLGLINDLEAYTKKVGLTENGTSPIVSVGTRENAELSKIGGVDLVINLKVVGSQKNIDDFVRILNNLPLVSYIEKIETRFDSVSTKNSAAVTLVIYQKNEAQ